MLPTSRLASPPEAAMIIKKGIPKPINISNILEPTALLMAIPPLPCLETVSDESRSGIDVPAANTVTAITASEILSI